MTAMHRGAFCELIFQWIYCCHSSKSTRKETGKTYLCAMLKKLDSTNEKQFFRLTQIYLASLSSKKIVCLKKSLSKCIWVRQNTYDPTLVKKSLCDNSKSCLTLGKEIFSRIFDAKFSSEKVLQG